MEGNTNLVLTFFSWWYGEAFAKLFVFLERFVIYLADFFSVKGSLKTLLAPWKRDQENTDNLSIQEKFQVTVLNLTSRLVGAIVKLLTIGLFLVVAGFTIIIETTILICWLGWPALVGFLIYFGIRTILGI